MQEDAFTLYAQWGPDRHSWMIVDEVDFHPLIRATSPDELVDAYQRRRGVKPAVPQQG